MTARWYVVNVYSGSEKKVAESLREQAVLKKMEDKILEVMVPTEEVVEILLEVFQDCGMIKISSREDEYYKIEFTAGIELSKALHSVKYAEFVELMNTINDYKNKFMTVDL